MSYWQERVLQNQANSIKIENKFLLEEKKFYKKLLSSINSDIDNLYIKMLEGGGEISTTELYSYGRYVNLKNEIINKCNSFGREDIGKVEEFLKKQYKKTFASAIEEKGSVRWGILEDNLMNKCISSEWSGKNFSERIWDNSSELAQRLDKSLRITIGKGSSLVDTKKALTNEFGVMYNRASTLVRTESNFIYNQACADRYESAGITQYEYLAEIDDRTSEICTDLDGEIFNIAEKQIGINCPPMHPNCRCTIIPIVSK